MWRSHSFFGSNSAQWVQVLQSNKLSRAYDLKPVCRADRRLDHSLTSGWNALLSVASYAVGIREIALILSVRMQRLDAFKIDLGSRKRTDICQRCFVISLVITTLESTIDLHEMLLCKTWPQRISKNLKDSDPFFTNTISLQRFWNKPFPAMITHICTFPIH